MREDRTRHCLRWESIVSTALTKFGYGQPTGIDLGNEANGIVPTPEWKQRIQKQAWYLGDTIITGIGQGFLLVTPLQLANAVAGLAMHGERWQPHVLLASQIKNNELVKNQPVALTPVEASPKNWEIIFKAMSDVVRMAGGTAAPYFQNAGYSAAGKTGTAQVFSVKQNQRYNANMLPKHLRDNSLFIVFAPVDHPRIAIAVIVQNSTMPAALVARRLLDFYLLNKPVDASQAAPAGSAARWDCRWWRARWWSWASWWGRRLVGPWLVGVAVAALVVPPGSVALLLVLSVSRPKNGFWVLQAARASAAEQGKARMGATVSARRLHCTVKVGEVPEIGVKVAIRDLASP